MTDMRRVGHAIRRRMGAPSSHLEMAAGGAWSRPVSDADALAHAEATAAGEVDIPIAGGRSMANGRAPRLKGVPDVYETGTATVGRGAGPPLARDNAAFASGVKGGVDAEPVRPRGRLSPEESAGARLTVSPSMKVPQESPVPTQAQGRIVPSQPSRQASFSTGIAEQQTR